MLRELEMSQLTFGAIFKITFWVGMTFWFVFSFFVIFFALSDPSVLSFNGRAAETRLEALLSVPIIWVIGGMISIFVSALGSLMFYMIRKFLPVGRFSYRSNEGEE